MIRINQQHFETQLENLIEKHLPVGFIDYAFLQDCLNLIKNRKNINRREILILAYMIGISSEETNALLESKEYPPLYVKKREDAIWKFALDNRKDPQEIINLVFDIQNQA